MQALLLLLAMILEKMVSAILMLPFLQISAQIISLNPDMIPHLLQGKNIIHYITKVSSFLRSESGPDDRSQKKITQEELMKIIYFPTFFRYSNGNHSVNKVNCEEDDALTAMIAYNKSGRNRTSVFSGKKSSSFYALDEPLPTLKDMCIRILQENVDRIDECGNLDYKVLQPILERAKPDDLMRIEEYNPKLMDDTGKIRIWITPISQCVMIVIFPWPQF